MKTLTRTLTALAISTLLVMTGGPGASALSNWALLQPFDPYYH